MTTQTHEATWNQYQDAWANLPPEDRQQLLSKSVAEDCTFASPNSNGHGPHQLTEQIEEFQRLYPNATFKTHTFLEHNNQALAEWIMVDGTGADFLPGKSYARFNADGRLTQLAGFWQL